MNSIYLIDYYSNLGKSSIHKLTIISKVIFFFCILFSIILSKTFSHLFFILFLIIFLIVLAQLPFLKILKWSLYPTFFAFLFAVSQINYGLLPFQTMLRALNAALLMLFMICTTPYPTLFNLIGRLSPFLASVFFMTYRYFFLIISEIQTKIKLMRIRGGYAGGIFMILKNLGQVIGHILIHFVEKSERLYNLMLIRGYRGKMFSKISYQFRILDLLFVMAGILIFLSLFYGKI
ncbi:MAG: energy-coupling factor transporter transmembrane component T [Nitrososphaerota archaeon]